MSDATNPPLVGEAIVRDRRSVYGDVTEAMHRTALVWSGILGHEVTAAQVALCMAGLKMVRSSVTPNYSDNSDDVDGYMAMFREIIGDDMIHARSTEEYFSKLNERAGIRLSNVIDINGGKP